MGIGAGAKNGLYFYTCRALDHKSSYISSTLKPIAYRRRRSSPTYHSVVHCLYLAAWSCELDLLLDSLNVHRVTPKLPWLSRHMGQPITVMAMLLDNELVSVLVNVQVFSVDHYIFSLPEDLCDLLERDAFSLWEVEYADDAA